MDQFDENFSDYAPDQWQYAKDFMKEIAQMTLRQLRNRPVQSDDEVKMGPSSLEERCDLIICPLAIVQIHERGECCARLATDEPIWALVYDCFA